MAWKKADKNNIKQLENFLLKNEVKCVSFSSKLKSTNSLSFFKNNTVLINENPKSHKIYEAILLSNHGLILPILDNENNLKIDNSQADEIFRNYSKKLFSILGIKKDVKKLQSYFYNTEIKKTVDYHLMLMNFSFFHKNETGNLNEGIKIRKTGIKDTEYLFELQKKYEKEEVLLNTDRFNKKLCIANLKMNLKTQVIYCAEYKDNAISKAGTNARGYKIDQIGGVFTEKKYRGRNVTLHVLKHLLNELSTEKEAVCLFVKKSNIHAINLYKKTGFKIIDEYRIAYYL